MVLNLILLIAFLIKASNQAQVTWTDYQTCSGTMIASNDSISGGCMANCRFLAQGYAHHSNLYNFNVPDSETDFCCLTKPAASGSGIDCQLFTGNSVSTGFPVAYRTIVFQAAYSCDPSLPVSSVLTTKPIQDQFVPYISSSSSWIDLQEQTFFNTPCLSRQCTAHYTSCTGSPTEFLFDSTTGNLKVKHNYFRLKIDSTEVGYYDICVKCNYQNEAFELTTTFRIFGTCIVYIDFTLTSTYIESTHEVFILDGSTNFPIVNIPVPNQLPTSLNSDGSCQL